MTNIKLNIDMPRSGMPLVSIVIPTYNHASFIGRALNSVIDQTYDNWEVIVVDNNSSDNTEEIVKRYGEGRIRYFKIENDGVVAVSRNIGIGYAKGDWIAFLDSDDCWSHRKLEICMKYAVKDIDLVYHRLIIRRNNKKLFQRKYVKSWQVKPPVCVDMLLKGNAIATSSVVVRKCMLQVIGGMNESKDMIAAEDYNAWLSIAEYTDKFLYLSDSLGSYYVHNQGLSRKDMSVSTRNAVSGFMYQLSKRQKHNVESLLMFMRSKYLFDSEYKTITIQDLLYHFSYGPLNIKFKSILLYLAGNIKWYIGKLKLLRS